MSTTELLYNAEVQVSEYLESWKIPDSYYFEFNKLGKLTSENSKVPIESRIAKNSHLGRIEYEAFRKIQERAWLENEGFIVWISPPYEGVYSTSKMVISEVVCENGTKRLLNRAIVTGWDSLAAVFAAREISELSGSISDAYKNPVDVRRLPIFIDKTKEEEFSKILEKKIDRKQMELILSGEDFQFRQMFIDAYLNNKIIRLGTGPLSCSKSVSTDLNKTAFQIFSEGEKVDEFGSLKFKCPACSRTNERSPHKLISNCKHCGADVSCSH